MRAIGESKALLMAAGSFPWCLSSHAGEGVGEPL